MPKPVRAADRSGDPSRASIAVEQVRDRLVLEARASGRVARRSGRRCRPSRPPGRARAARRRSARRGARCPSRRGRRSARCAPAICAGHCEVRAARDRLALGAHDRRRRRRGSSSGITNLRSAPVRRLGIGATTSGITSPARRTTTVSPMQHALALDLVGVVQRRHRDGHAADADRLEHRERGHRAGAPDADLDVAERGASAPRAGTCRRSPSAETSRSRPARARRRSESTFTTAPSISCSQLVPALAPVGARRRATSSSVGARRFGSGCTAQAERRAASRASPA